ncbi:hemerythrin family protein [bacterium]|nr:hemerythrin family protein [bacterium]
MAGVVQVEWDDSLSVGVPFIDEQHKRLIEIINKLDTACKKGQAREVVGQLIHGLGEYAIYHFSAEQDQMRLTEYPETAAHVAQHQEFIQKLMEIDAKFKASNVLLSSEILLFLRNWYLNHIRLVDKKLGAYLLARHRESRLAGPEDPPEPESAD